MNKTLLRDLKNYFEKKKILKKRETELLDRIYIELKQTNSLFYK